MNNLSKSITYPNQRTVKIHREKATTDFLGIKNENWKAASRDLSAHALKLYMYLASNADNFELALSPAAILKEIGMARSTYHDQFHILENKGYITVSYTHLHINFSLILNIFILSCHWHHVNTFVQFTLTVFIDFLFSL